MTEVVTNGAAFMQPFLQPNRQQANGVSNSDSPQFSLQIGAEASRAQAATAAQEVPRASEDRSSLQNDSSPQPNSQPEQSRLKAAPAHAAAPANAAPTGPSKARVELPPLQLAQPASTSVASLTPAAPQAAAQAEAAPAPTPAPEPAAPAANQAPQLTPGALGAAATLSTLSLENLSQNIIGVAFAPTQVVQSAQTETVVAQPQRNFIFAQRKVYAEAEQAGKFVAAEKLHVIAQEDAKTPKFALQAVAQAVTTAAAAGKFAAHETSQKLSDKVPQHETSTVQNGGEARLYDKVPQADAGNRSAQDDAEQHAQGRDSNRESLYQRAEAIAYALGSKADNPEVKKLIADIARYRASVEGGANPAALIVTA